MNFNVKWSDEDREWVGTCDEFPSLSFLARDSTAAIDGIVELAYAARDDISAGRVREGEQ